MVYSNLACVVSDVHFPKTDWTAWAAFKKWHKEVRPRRTICLGDMVDFEELSRYVKSSNVLQHAVESIDLHNRELNSLLESTEQMDVTEGNHGGRFDKLFEHLSPVLKDLQGFTFQEQCYMRGLNKSIRWHKESAKTHGIRDHQFLLRHGDKQSGRFGAGMHIAYNALVKSFGQSQIQGHNHQVQLYAMYAGETLGVSMVNGTFEEDQDFNQGYRGWVKGFTILEYVDDKWATPYPVIIRDGKFAWGGKVYDGAAPSPVVVNNLDVAPIGRTPAEVGGRIRETVEVKNVAFVDVMPDIDMGLVDADYHPKYIIEQFLSNIHDEMRRPDLYALYKSTCEDIGAKPQSVYAFLTEARELEFTERKTRGEWLVTPPKRG